MILLEERFWSLLSKIKNSPIIYDLSSIRSNLLWNMSWNSSTIQCYQFIITNIPTEATKSTMIAKEAPSDALDQDWASLFSLFLQSSTLFPKTETWNHLRLPFGSWLYYDFARLNLVLLMSASRLSRTCKYTHQAHRWSLSAICSWRIMVSGLRYRNLRFATRKE